LIVRAALEMSTASFASTPYTRNSVQVGALDSASASSAAFPDFGYLFKSRQKGKQAANDVVGSLPIFFHENLNGKAERSAPPRRESRDWLRRALLWPIASA
jgi:hypothetical protein